jgi:hypothetical protein
VQQVSIQSFQYQSNCGSACNPGDNQIGGGSCGLFGSSSYAVCLHQCAILQNNCVACAPGTFGTACQPCPGGQANPCTGHGFCSQGISGNGACSCNVGFLGPDCSQTNSAGGSPVVPAVPWYGGIVLGLGLFAVGLGAFKVRRRA